MVLVGCDFRGKLFNFIWIACVISYVIDDFILNEVFNAFMMLLLVVVVPL